MNIEEAERLLTSYLSVHFHVGLSDVEFADSKGYWRFKKPCNESCRHPLHGCIGNEDRMQHTIYFAPELRDEKGRFLSQYTVWRTLKKGAQC